MINVIVLVLLLSVNTVYAGSSVSEYLSNGAKAYENKNYEEAVKWYRKSAEQGYSGALYNLGMCYFYGKGVRKDRQEAVKWFRKAAEQGNASAKKTLDRLGIKY